MRENGSSGKLRPTLAMQASVANPLWNLRDLYGRVTNWDAERQKIARYRRLADRLRKG